MKLKHLAILAALSLWAGQIFAAESSLLKAVTYDPDNRVLRITFADGSQYDYAEVKEATYNELLEASSQGDYFNDKIRNKFKTTKVQMSERTTE